MLKMISLEVHDITVKLKASLTDKASFDLQLMFCASMFCFIPEQHPCKIQLTPNKPIVLDSLASPGGAVLA